ncbi:MAG: hypothetical protein JXR41_01300 [Bacteroidales bacterium]|nr:hypothetical protein [Bacteroidales bacterium]
MPHAFTPGWQLAECSWQSGLIAAYRVPRTAGPHASRLTPFLLTFSLLYFLQFAKFVNKTAGAMDTASYKRTYNLPKKETLVYRARKMSERIKTNNLTTDDIVAEVTEYRKKRNAW